MSVPKLVGEFIKLGKGSLCACFSTRPRQRPLRQSSIHSLCPARFYALAPCGPLFSSAQSPLSAELIKMIDASGTIRPDLMAQNDAEEDFLDHNASALLIIPAEFITEILQNGTVALDQRLLPNNIGALAAAGVGMAFGSFIKTAGQVNGVAIMSGMLMALLGGCWYPIELFPAVVQNITRILPTRWAMEGILDIALRGQGLSGVLPAVGVLLGFAVVFFAFGVWRFRYE